MHVVAFLAVGTTYLLLQLPVVQPDADILTWMTDYLEGKDTGESPRWENSPLCPLSAGQLLYAAEHPECWFGGEVADLARLTRALTGYKKELGIVKRGCLKLLRGASVTQGLAGGAGVWRGFAVTGAPACLSCEHLTSWRPSRRRQHAG
jgi:hypothetical protein